MVSINIKTKVKAHKYTRFIGLVVQNDVYNCKNPPYESLPNTVKDAKRAIDLLTFFGCKDIRVLNNPTRREFSKAL